MDNDIEQNVKSVGALIHEQMLLWKDRFPAMIADVRGRGLLLAMEMALQLALAERIFNEALKRGLILNLIQAKVVCLCPALEHHARRSGDGPVDPGRGPRGGRGSGSMTAWQNG